MYKVLVVLTKLEAVTDKEFCSHWKKTHGELAKQLPGLRRYVQKHIIKHERSSLNSIPVNGFAELWFDSKEAMEQAFASEIGKKVIADESLFIADVDAYSIKEITIL